jgi:mevalonate kinase
MGAAVDMGLTGCINDDRAKLALSMRMYQGYMHALGVVDSETHLLLAQLARDPRCLAAKISGSGLGDCIIALGSDLAEIPYQNIAVNMTTHGVCIEQG